MSLASESSREGNSHFCSWMSSFRSVHSKYLFLFVQYFSSSWKSEMFQFVPLSVSAPKVLHFLVIFLNVPFHHYKIHSFYWNKLFASVIKMIHLYVNILQVTWIFTNTHKHTVSALLRQITWLFLFHVCFRCSRDLLSAVGFMEMELCVSTVFAAHIVGLCL